MRCYFQLFNCLLHLGLCFYLSNALLKVHEDILEVNDSFFVFLLLDVIVGHRFECE